MVLPDAEQSCCLKPVTAVGCACFADICISEHHRRACMSYAVQYSLLVLYERATASRLLSVSLCYSIECGDLDTHSYDS